MDFKEYVKLAMRTNAEGKSFKDNITNGIFGLVGETAELLEELRIGNTENIINELGDVYWYTALLFHTTGMVPTPTTFDKNMSIVTCVGDITDHFKKHFFQGHELDSDYMNWKLSVLKRLLDDLAGALTSAEDVMTRNIEKLKRRFPDGFDVDKSINREE